MVVHPFNPRTQRLRKADLYEFEASLVYIGQPRLYSETLPQRRSKQLLLRENTKWQMTLVQQEGLEDLGAQDWRS